MNASLSLTQFLSHLPAHLPAHLGGWAAGIVAAAVLERGLARLARQAVEAARPLGGEPEEQRTMRYERSLATPATADLHWLRLGLVLCGGALWLGLAWHAAAWVAAAALLLACLAWDLWTWQVVVASPWQIAWRRGWRQSVRRLPLAQVAAVHVVERPATGALARAAARAGLRLGWAYLALEFHSGRAAKLPRTDLTFGLPRVRRMAQFILQRQDQAMRERRHAILEALRACRRAPRILPDPQELALRRELAALRGAAAHAPAWRQPRRLPALPLLTDSSAG